MDQPLLDYQLRTLAKMQGRQPGLVIAHGTGLGKTRQAIEIYKNLGLPATIVVPAALKANYQKELKKWLGKTPDNVQIETQQAVAKNGLKYDPPGGLLVVDEAHRARNLETALFKNLQKTRAAKRLFLTATPVFNHPSEIASLVNLAAGKNILPPDKRDFEKKYLENKQVDPSFYQRLLGVKPGIQPVIKHEKELVNALKTYVDYVGGRQEGFPASLMEEVRVPMSDAQTDIYKTILGQAPLWMRMKVKAGLPPNKKEIEAMRAFMTGLRQVSNTSRGYVNSLNKEESPKINKAFDFLQEKIKTNPRYKAVVYSNYINSGLAPYKALLERAGVPYGEFSGDVSRAKRNKMVEDYNADKLKALLVSSAGAEGLDLKGTRLVQLLEPHFNEEKEKQIIGRGIRYKSHDHLPENEKNVLVQRYLAKPKAGLLNRVLGQQTDKGTDEYIRQMALAKSLATGELSALMGNLTKKKMFL